MASAWGWDEAIPGAVRLPTHVTAGISVSRFDSASLHCVPWASFACAVSPYVHQVMNAAERQPYLLAVDAVLTPLGFARRKRDYEWKRKDGADTEWVHLNFGLEVINPSCGVVYRDLENIVPEELGHCVATARMLAEISSVVIYTQTDTPPAKIASDVAEFALPEIARHRDRRAVIEALQRAEAKDWPVHGAYLRKRFLPLLLTTSGRVAEAHDWLARLEALPPLNEGPGQYAAFATFLREKYPV